MIFELNRIHRNLIQRFGNENVAVQSIKVGQVPAAIDLLKEDHSAIKAQFKLITLDVEAYKNYTYWVPGQGDVAIADSTVDSVADALWDKIQVILVNLTNVNRRVFLSNVYIEYNPEITYLGMCKVKLDIAAWSYDGTTFKTVVPYYTDGAGDLDRSSNSYHKIVVAHHLSTFKAFDIRVHPKNVLKEVQDQDTGAYFSTLLARFDLEVEAHRSKLVKMQRAGLAYDKVQNLINLEIFVGAAELLGVHFGDPGVCYRTQGDFKGFQIGSLIYTPASVLELILLDGGFYGEVKPQMKTMQVNA